jgi:hypothetical protein
MAQACWDVGAGVLTIQGRGRTPDTVRRRAVVAWLLHKGGGGWTQKKIAVHLCRTQRQIKNLLRIMK